MKKDIIMILLGLTTSLMISSPVYAMKYNGVAMRVNCTENQQSKITMVIRGITETFTDYNINYDTCKSIAPYWGNCAIPFDVEVDMSRNPNREIKQIKIQKALPGMRVCS